MRKLLFQSLLQSALTEPAPAADDAQLAELAQSLDRAARRRLGRSLSIREVDAGSCNGCELEIHALNNAFYDIERFGLRFVASPRHADVLLVTGPVTKNMREALERTYAATPDPKWVVAAGDCARELRRLRRQLCLCRRAFPPSFPSICTSAAARPARRRCSRACSRWSIAPANPGNRPGISLGASLAGKAMCQSARAPADVMMPSLLSALVTLVAFRTD